MTDDRRSNSKKSDRAHDALDEVKAILRTIIGDKIQPRPGGYFVAWRPDGEDTKCCVHFELDIDTDMAVVVAKAVKQCAESEK